MLPEQHQSIAIPISPMKKLKILAENHNIHNKTEFATKFDVINENDDDLKRVKNSESHHVEQNVQEKFVEPLLKETVDQYVIFPIKHEDIWEKYKLLVENFWSATENLEHLELLMFNENEYKYLRYLSEFFSCFDLAKDNGGGLVNENFSEEFSKLIQVTEAKFFYGHLLFVQNVHYEMFNKLYQVLVKNHADSAAFEEHDAVKRKRNLLLNWYKAESTFAEKLVLAACLHGVLFTAINLTQQWIDKRLNLKANHELVDNVQRMIVDQDLARDFACLMVSYLKQKPSEDFLFKQIEEAVAIERDFLLNALPIHLIGVSARDVNILLDKRSNILKIKLLHAFKSNGGSSAEKAKSGPKTDTAENKNSVKKPQIQQHQKPVFDEDF